MKIALVIEFSISPTVQKFGLKFIRGDHSAFKVRAKRGEGVTSSKNSVSRIPTQ